MRAFENFCSDRFFPYILQDWDSNRGDLRIQLILALFRYGSRKRNRNNRSPLHMVYRKLYRFISEWIFGMEIPLSVHVGPRLRIRHGYGLVLHSQTRIGSDCILRQGVTLGIRSKNGAENGAGVAPIVGDGVEFGSGSQVLGYIEIGDGALIGSGAVVLTPVPSRGTAVGNPARIIPPR